MLILVVEPGRVPETRDISGSLKEMQSIVGGYIQAIYPSPGIALVCNEEGWLRGLPGNRGLRDGSGEVNNIIWGTFFLCGAPADGEDFVDLTPEQAEQLEKQFHTPEAFVGSNGRILCVPCPAGTFMEPSQNPAVPEIRDGGVSLCKGVESCLSAEKIMRSAKKPALTVWNPVLPEHRPKVLRLTIRHVPSWITFPLDSRSL